MMLQSLVPSLRKLSLFALPVLLWVTAFANAAEHTSARLSTAAGGLTQYIVRLEGAGLLDYRGEISGLGAVSISRGARPRELARSPAALAYIDYLDQQQTQKLSEIVAALGHSVKVVHRFKATENGFAMRLSPQDAAAIAVLPGVVSVKEEPMYQLATDRGPTFIGADTIWDGSAVPANGFANRGEGMVIGVVDTGINTDHPSFAAVGPVDGYVHTNPFGSYLGDCIGAGGLDTVTCNDKLIGAYDFTPDGTPEDSIGHGSHTSSIATGNLLNGPFIDGSTGAVFAAASMSGVAQHANVIMYKACFANGCFTASAIDQAIIDGVDAINYSIGPVPGGRGISPWLSDDDSRFLQAVGAGIFVAASAGNTGGTNPNPGADVSHKGPWIATVANSTHDRINKNRVDITGPGSPAANVQDLYGLFGTGPAFTGDIVDADIFLGADVDAANADGCAAWIGTPFAGGIALVDRGACNFSAKVDNAEAGGAIAVIVANNVSDLPIVMGAQETNMIPSVMVGQSDGAAMGAFITGNVSPTVSVDGDSLVGIAPLAGGVLSAGSLIGPNVDFDITKPSITGPGSNIFAAYHDALGVPPQMTFLSGTSMSGPHIAGSGVLMKVAHPSWSVMEIKSAIMLTADTSSTKPDGITLADPDDVGSGYADLSRAVQSGLVMHETNANMVAADPGIGGDPKTVNIPSMRNTGCNPECSWTRKVRSVVAGTSSWTAAGAGNGYGVTVTPAAFNLEINDILFADSLGDGTAPDFDSQVLTITASSVASGDVMAFGTVTLTETGAQAPDAVLTVAVSQTVPPLPPVR